MKHIGILIERHRVYGRSICLGISRFAQECGDWVLHLLDWTEIGNQKALSSIDLNGDLIDRQSTQTYPIDPPWLSEDLRPTSEPHGIPNHRTSPTEELTLSLTPPSS